MSESRSHDNAMRWDANSRWQTQLYLRTAQRQASVGQAFLQRPALNTRLPSPFGCPTNRSCDTRVER